MSKRSVSSLSSYSFARVTKVFQPISASLKQQVKGTLSHELLVKEGCIQHCSNGFYALLPLAQRSYDKLSRLVEKEMNAIGAQKLILPTLTPVQLWKQTGRWNAEPELMCVHDRQEKQYLLSPTHEEAICDVMSQGYGQRQAQLPLLLYQISAKFRDETRPRHALLRAREFVMKDLYSFDADESSASETYGKVTEAYNSVLSKIGVPYVRVEGSCGDIGGVYSHEYHYESESGQDCLLRCTNCGHCCSETLLVETGVAAQGADVRCSVCSHGPMARTLGVEIGHTFLLGTKYSKPLNAVYRNSAGAAEPLVMGCYGLGLTRLLQAAVQRCSGQLGDIVWPWAIAPYRLCIITPKRGSKEGAAASWTEYLAQSLQAQVSNLRNELIVDDRDSVSIGARVAAARRTGYPLILVLGKNALNDKPLFELIDNTVAYRGLTDAPESPLASEGVEVDKRGVLMTHFELVCYLEKFCNAMQNVRQ